MNESIKNDWYTCCEGELILLGVNKYGGGSIKVYPDNDIIFWTGGHSNQYFEEYIKISGDTAVYLKYNPSIVGFVRKENNRLSSKEDNRLYVKNEKI